MKAAFPIFIAFCFFFLVKDPHYLSAGSNYHSLSHSVNRPLSAPLTGKDLVLKANDRITLTESSVMVEIEEDEGFAMARKYVLLGKSFLVLAYILSLACFYRFFKENLFTHHHLAQVSADKFILHGVLRI